MTTKTTQVRCSRCDVEIGGPAQGGVYTFPRKRDVPYCYGCGRLMTARMRQQFQCERGRAVSK